MYERKYITRKQAERYWPKMSKNFYIHKTINGKKKTLHRHVMEEHLGRALEHYEHVYHINGDSTDNRIENLIMITKKYRNE